MSGERAAVTSLDRQFEIAAARKAHAIPTQFETDRLLIRQGTANDFDATLLVARASADALKRWMPWAHPAPIAESMEKYFSTVEAKWASREMLDFQWIEKSSGQLIGKGGFHHIDWAIPKFEVGYWLATAATGQGYCTEAVNGLVNFVKTSVFPSTPIRKSIRLEIRAQPSNHASRAVAERAGFTLEGINRHALLGADSSLCDACMYALIAE